MKKITTVAILAMTLVSCERETDNLTLNESTTHNFNKIGTSGPVQGVFQGVYFAPSGTLCGGGSGEPASPISGMSSGIPAGIDIPGITAEFNSPLPTNGLFLKYSLPELITAYLIDHNVKIEQPPIYDDIVPPNSYFNTASHQQYTFTDNKYTFQSDFPYFSKYSYMNNNVASSVIQNAYDKVIHNPNSPTGYETKRIRAIRYKYDEYLCGVDGINEKDFKIFVVYY